MTSYLIVSLNNNEIPQLFPLCNTHLHLRNIFILVKEMKRMWDVFMESKFQIVFTYCTGAGKA